MSDDGTAERPAGGRERLLAAAIRHLDTHGEADLRVTDIADEADVALGLIRHHFGSRDGLVVAAQQRRVEGATREDLEGGRRALSAVEDNDALLARITELTSVLTDRRRSEVRLSRFAAIATAHGRPEARELISNTLGDLLDDLSVLIMEAQLRGLVRRDLDARAVATFIQSYALGLIIHDMDPKQPDPQKLTAVIVAALGTVLGPPD
jgi:AcrR family transcriptional regulator